MDKRFKWGLNHPYYSARACAGPGDYYYPKHANKNYIRQHHSHSKHDTSGSKNYYYKPPRPNAHGLASIGAAGAIAPPAPGNTATAGNASSDLVTLIVENNNLKRMIVLHMNLMQEQTDNIAAKDKELEEESSNNAALLSQNQKLIGDNSNLKEENAKLEEENAKLEEENAKLEEAIEDLRRQLRRNIKRPVNADNDDHSPPTSQARVLCHVETQTIIGMSMVHMPNQVQPHPPPLHLQHQQELEEPDTKQIVQYEQKLQILPPQEQQQKELHNEPHYLQPLTDPHFQLSKPKVLVTSVAQLPSVAPATNASLNTSDSKVRGEFNGGKKVSTIILRRVNQESSLISTSNHSVHDEHAELDDGPQLVDGEVEVVTETIIGAEEEVSRCGPVDDVGEEVELEEETADNNDHIEIQPVEIPVESSDQELPAEEEEERPLVPVIKSVEVKRIDIERPAEEEEEEERPLVPVIKSVEVKRIDMERPLNIWNDESSRSKSLSKLVLTDTMPVAPVKRGVSNDIGLISKNQVTPSAHSTPNHQQKVQQKNSDVKKLEPVAVTANEDHAATKRVHGHHGHLRYTKDKIVTEDHLEYADEGLLQTEEVQNESIIDDLHTTIVNISAASAAAAAFIAESKRNVAAFPKNKHITQKVQSEPAVGNYLVTKLTQKKQMELSKKPRVGPLSSKLSYQQQQSDAVKSNCTAPVPANYTKTSKATAQEPRILSIEEQTKQKLHKHIYKQLTQVPTLHLKKFQKEIKNSNLIFPPEPTTPAAASTPAAPITPAPTPTTTPSSTPQPTPISSASPQSKTEVTGTKATPLTPQSISSVSSTTSNSRRTVNNCTPHAYTKIKPTSRFLSTPYLYTTRAYEDQEVHCDFEFFLEEAEQLFSDNPHLEIPKWEQVELQPTTDNKDIEPLLDDDFIKRHEPHVRDENIRKKRDARSVRDQITCENLRKRHNQDEVIVKLDPLPMSTFYPLPSDIESVEFVNDVFVQAFGENLVNLQTRTDFTLPWLDETNAKTAIATAKARAMPVATLSSKKLRTTAAEARHQEMNSSFVFLKRRKQQRRQR
ncbi:protein male-specific lethal-1 [Scaptodrosophila lebanonensis]|uniref:Protein male-specific lethal-1 n=1 Tax=Drosophila lebanonensis TaxID=7225 RepID=A0A6J2U9B5_DROLE|nr:protein male-specific lethal-1 [Scaptodrosophila lebanonensis]